MKPKDQQTFSNEIEEARKRLAESGRNVEFNDVDSDESGIQCDFELPYSSLPTIRTEKWV